MDNISLSDTNGAEVTFPTPSNSATDLTQSVDAPSFLHVIQLFLIHKTLLAHQACKQIQGVIVRKSGILFTLSVSISVLSRDTETVTLQESRADLCFLFFLASSRSIYSLSRLFLTSTAFQKRSPY